MINKVFHWECGCEKCGHSWSTRSDKLSKACPGCKSWTWNSEPVDEVADVPEMDVSQKLESLGVSVGFSAPVEEPDEWDGWSDEKEEYDGATGETIVYRKQLVKPFRIQEIRREH